MIGQIFDMVVPVYGILLVGLLRARRHAPDLAVANRLNLEVFTPALLFDVLAAKDFQLTAYLHTLPRGTAIVLGCGLVAWAASRALRIPPRSLVPPMMFVNSGDMGLPLAATVVLLMVENLAEPARRP